MITNYNCVLDITSYVELKKNCQASKMYVGYTRKCIYLKGARMRNYVEKDVVITVDKCRKERRNRNSRRLMTPSISFYTSCDVTKHQLSFPFWILDAYSRVKSVHLERHPLPSPYLTRFVHVHCAWPCCKHVAYVCGKTTDIKRAYRTWNPERVPKGREANGPPGSRALLLLWLMTCDPPSLSPVWLVHLPPIYHFHWELTEEETRAHCLELEANVFNVSISSIKSGEPRMFLTLMIQVEE